MRRQLVAICAALLCALAGGPSVSPGAAAPWPVWLEVPWSFPIDQWGKGKAFTCKAADCGTAVTVYVRDRGAGFDPAAVPLDRRGVRDSIIGRMSRHGGHATISSTPDAGTEVELVLPRESA